MIEISPDFRVKSWSFSSLSQYETCPLQYYAEKTKQVERKTSAALERGTALHLKAEKYLDGTITGGIPSELRMFSPEMLNLRHKKAVPEEAIVLDSHWNFIGGEEAWSSEDAWLRCKIDARVDNFVVDFKTGKPYAKHGEQAELYATVLMQRDLFADDMTVEFWYFNSGEVASFSFTRSEQRNRIANWGRRVQRMMDETQWQPKVNSYCKWCPVAEAGKCKANQENVM